MDQQINNEYGVKVGMFIKDPKYRGTISDEEAKELDASIFSYTYGDEAVGYKLTFHWAVDKLEDTVLLARFTYEGVPSGIAVNHMMALLFTKKSMTEIDTINYPALERLLRDNPQIEALPASEKYAITFGVDAAKLAVKEYTKQLLSHDEETIPCKDSPMSIASIKESIKEHNIQTLETLAEYTKAGSTDASCKDELLEWIEANKNTVAEQEAAENALSAVPFKDMSPDHRIIAVETAIDNTVRKFLVMDGGDIDILSVKEKGDQYEVYISYLGACSSCDSSGTGTLMAIENALKDKLDPNIRVIPI